MQIRPIDEAIFRELALCRLLTIKQIRNRFFSPGSYTHVSTLLRQLTNDSYLTALSPPAQNQPYLYGLGKKGVRFLREAGMLMRYHPSEHMLPSSIHLAHLLTTNTLLLAAARLHESTRGVVVVDRRHYLTTNQKNRTCIPDAWIHLEVDHIPCALWCEVDRGSEDQKYITRKIQSILDFSKEEYTGGSATGVSAYTREFGIPLLAIAFVTTKGAYRLDKLLHWTELVLKQIDNPAYNNRLRFTHISEDLDTGLDPRELFCVNRWHQPGTSGLASLL